MNHLIQQKFAKLKHTFLGHKVDDPWLVNREWCQHKLKLKLKAMLVHGRGSFPVWRSEPPAGISRVQETNTLAGQLRWCMELHTRSVYPTCFLLLGWTTCSVLELTVYCCPGSQHILPFHPKFDIPKPFIQLLSPVSCASVFISGFLMACGSATCWRWNAVSPWIHKLKSNP